MPGQPVPLRSHALSLILATAAAAGLVLLVINHQLPIASAVVSLSGVVCVLVWRLERVAFRASYFFASLDVPDPELGGYTPRQAIRGDILRDVSAAVEQVVADVTKDRIAA